MALVGDAVDVGAVHLVTPVLAAAWVAVEPVGYRSGTGGCGHGDDSASCDEKRGGCESHPLLQRHGGHHDPFTQESPCGDSTEILVTSVTSLFTISINGL